MHAFVIKVFSEWRRSILKENVQTLPRYIAAALRKQFLQSDHRMCMYVFKKVPVESGDVVLGDISNYDFLTH